MDLLQKFSAISDYDGRTVMLYVWQDQVDIGTRGNPGATMGGLKRLRTSDGIAVNHIEQGVYQIPMSVDADFEDEILRSKDSEAP
jgi:hypothetical protein